MGIRPSDPDDFEDAPGPTVWSLVQMVPRMFQEDPVEIAVVLRERHGHVVRIPPVYPGLDRPAYLVTHPEDVQRILQTDPTQFRGLDVPGAMDFGKVVSNSIVSLTEDSEEGSWMARLRKLAPEFNERAVATHVPTFAAETLATLAEYDTDAAGRTTAQVSTASQGGRVGRLFGSSEDPARVQADPPGAVRLLPMMRRLSLRLLGVSVFGADVRVHEAEVIRSVATLRRQFQRRQLHVLTGAITRHLPDRVTLPEVLGHDLAVPLPGSQQSRIDEAVETLETVADEIVARRERVPRTYDDALSTWLTRPDPATGEVLAPEIVRKEVVGLVIAGFATLSSALSWAVYLAATHPSVQERIHAEARETALFASLEAARDDTVPVGGDGTASASDDGTASAAGGTVAGDAVSADGDGRADDGGNVDADASAGRDGSVLDELPFTRRVWQETLRLYPTLPVFGRMAREPAQFRGYDVEADAPVLVSPYVTHRDPAFWDDPEVFDPDRFTPERSRDRPAFAYYPFSGGPHSCLGEALATAEAIAALAAMFSTHRVELVSEDISGEGPDADPDRTAAGTPGPLDAGSVPSVEVGIDSGINLQPDRELVVRFVPR